MPIYGGGTLSSTNATGTTFTVADVGTGLHVIGGAGTDTLVLQGQSFTAGQRAAIFGLGSVEAIVDASGSYVNPAPNSPPAITSDGGGASATVSVAENATFVTTVTAVDPDPGSSVSYAIIGGADALAFTIDETSGVLAFVSAPDYEAPTDFGQDNDYQVLVKAIDNHGAIDTQAIAVTVTNQNEAPVITSNGGGRDGFDGRERHGGDRRDGVGSGFRGGADLRDHRRRGRGHVHHRCWHGRAAVSSLHRITKRHPTPGRTTSMT